VVAGHHIAGVEGALALCGFDFVLHFDRSRESLNQVCFDKFGYTAGDGWGLSREFKINMDSDWSQCQTMSPLRS